MHLESRTVLVTVDCRGKTRFASNFQRAFPIVEALGRVSQKVKLLNVNDPLAQLEDEAHEGVVFVLADTFAAGSEGANSWPEPYGFRRWLQRVNASFVGSTYEGICRSSSASKPRARHILARADLVVPRGMILRSLSQDAADRALRSLSSPVVVKPAHGSGAGVGIHLADSADSLRKLLAWHRTGRNQDRVVVEEFIPGREVTAWVFEDKGKPFCYGLVETRKPASAPLLDHGARIRSKTVQQFSSGHPLVPEAVTNPQFARHLRTSIEDSAIRAHQACRLRHFSRVDMILSEGTPYILDINAAPEISEADLGQVAQARGEDLPRALERLVFEASHVA